MKPLKDFVAVQDKYGFSDLQVIKLYLNQDDFDEEEKLLAIMYDLAKTKIVKRKKGEE